MAILKNFEKRDYLDQSPSIQGFFAERNTLVTHIAGLPPSSRAESVKTGIYAVPDQGPLPIVNKLWTSGE